MHTTRSNTDHGKCVTAICDALESLQDAILAEKDCRASIQADDSEAAAKIPGLKFPILLSTSKQKPFAMITDWRRWAASAGWKVRGA